jgi:hypothetical protein
VFLNFLVGIWSGTDVEIAVIGPTVASAAAAGAFSLPSLLVRPPIWRCFWVAAGAIFCLFKRCKGDFLQWLCSVDAATDGFALP